MVAQVVSCEGVSLRQDRKTILKQNMPLPGQEHVHRDWAALAACVAADAASQGGCAAACVVAACVAATSQGGCAAASWFSCMAALAACMAMSVDEPAAPPAEGQLYVMCK